MKKKKRKKEETKMERERKRGISAKSWSRFHFSLILPCLPASLYVRSSTYVPLISQYDPSEFNARTRKKGKREKNPFLLICSKPGIQPFGQTTNSFQQTPSCTGHSQRCTHTPRSKLAKPKLSRNFPRNIPGISSFPN